MVSAKVQIFMGKIGHNRNKEMALYAEALILVWDGKSSGSQSMLKLAKERGLKIYEKIVEDDFGV